MQDRIFRGLSLLICLGFLAFGLIRVGVGFALIGATQDWWHFEDLALAVSDTRDFLAEANGRALLPFSVPGYFAYIVAMGVVLSLGAWRTIRRLKFGLWLITIYLAMHGALFANFLTINPKIAYLAVGIALVMFLAWQRRRESSATT